MVCLLAWRAPRRHNAQTVETATVVCHGETMIAKQGRRGRVRGESAVRWFVAAAADSVATHETSLYQKRANRRKDFALGDVFGAHYEAMRPPAARSLGTHLKHAVT